MKKYFQLYRLGIGLACKTVLSYFFQKILKVSLFNNQESLIAYFNILVNFNLWHVSSHSSYNIIRSDEFGLLAMRWPPSSDGKVYQQVFSDKEYEALSILIDKHIPGKEVRMIDAGANVGFVSIFINQRIRSSKKLRSILVEPFAENLKMIELNLALQGINDFHLEESAIYNRNANLSVRQSFRDYLEWSVQVEETAGPSDLKGVQIADLMIKYGWDMLDVLKLDIEGDERFLFSDKDYALSFLKSIKIIVIELHKEYIDENLVLSCLEEFGFHISRYGELFYGIRNVSNPF